jgi:hypothetical protein
MSRPLKAQARTSWCWVYEVGRLIRVRNGGREKEASDEVHVNCGRSAAVALRDGRHGERGARLRALARCEEVLTRLERCDLVAGMAQSGAAR